MIEIRKILSCLGKITEGTIRVKRFLFSIDPKSHSVRTIYEYAGLQTAIRDRKARTSDGHLAEFIYG